SAIPQATRAEVTLRQDRRVRASSAQMPGDVEYELGREAPRRAWIDYVQGVTHQLDLPRGFDLSISSTVPIGSGLSSSAALEVSVLKALDAAFGLGLDAVAMARIGQRAENEVVGAQTGVMDQMAASLADLGTALFLDTRSLEYERVPLPPDAELAVINSGVA